MWWGGGGEEDDVKSAGSSGDNDSTPPIDIMAEEAERERELDSSPTASFMSEDAGELRALKDQFAMQENLLGQLQTVLKSNEEKLHNKEKEVQVPLHYKIACVTEA